jgi:hypothetical protein
MIKKLRNQSHAPKSGASSQMETKRKKKPYFIISRALIIFINDKVFPVLN